MKRFLLSTASVFGGFAAFVLLLGAAYVAPVQTFTCSSGQFANALANSGSFTCGIPSGGGGGGNGLYGGAMSTLPTSSGTGLTNWLNQGPSGGSTGSVADTAVGVSITAPAASGDEMRVRYKTAPGTTPYSFTALVSNTEISADYSGVGIGWTDGTKLEVISIGHSSSWLVNVAQWATTNGTNSGVGTSLGLSDGRPIWFKIRNDGTTVYFQFSYDGINFITLYSETASSGFLSGSYTDVLFYANGNNHDSYGTLMSWAQGS